MKRFLLAALAMLCARTVLAQCPSVDWGAPQSLSNPTAVHDLVALDFDNDGKLDLVGEMDTPPPVINDDLYSWRGRGDGTFEAPVSLDEHFVRDVVKADVNNDGRPDVVMATYRGVVSVRLNTGAGLGPAVTTNTNGFQADRIAVGHFDNDGIVDVVVGSYWSNLFVIYHGVGNGTFTEIRREPAPTPLPVMAADFDGDGRTDVAYAVREQKSVRVSFRNADGTFASAVALPAADFPSDIATGDFNEDGRQDLVAVNWEDFSTLPLRSVMVYLSAGSSRTFTRSIMTSRIVNSTASYASVKTGDVNGDGHQDIVTTAMNGSLSLTFLGNGDGTFRSATHLVVPDPYDISLGDVDGDSRPDLIIGGWDGLATLKNLCATHVHLYSISPVTNPGQAAPFRALVSGVAATMPSRGTVTFREGATVLGTADVDANGVASLDYTGLALGTHTITADYGGNGVLGAATSGNISQLVKTEATSVYVVLPPGQSSSYGTPYGVDVDLYAPSTGSYGSGWVMVAVDGVEVQQGWAGSKIYLNLTAGPHVLTARFFGDQNRAPATSAPVNIVTAKASTAMNYAGTLSVRQGTSHSIDFQVNGPQGYPPPGTVSLQRGSTVLATAPVVNNAAHISVLLPRGAHDLTAVYSGDANFNSNAVNLTLSVLPNIPIAIDARGLASAISIRALLPPGASDVTLFRRVSGNGGVLLPVNGWTPSAEYDFSAERGVLYDYRLDATVNGNVESSNLDSAILFTDEGLTSGQQRIHHVHFDELRLAVNALRANAGLAPFSYDNLFAGAVVRAAHLAALRNALTEARQALGMTAATYTDAAAPGTVVRAVQIQELRELSR
jgi:hypothetical protein